MENDAIPLISTDDASGSSISIDPHGAFGRDWVSVNVRPVSVTGANSGFLTLSRFECSRMLI